jgi:hypothetical protein
VWGLLLEVLRVVDDSLDRVHVVLQFGDLTNQPSERLLGADYVAESETGLSRGDGEAGGDGEDGDDEGEEETEHVDPDTQPTLIRDCQPVCPGTEKSVPRTRSDGGANKPVFDVHPFLALLPEPIGFTVRSDSSKTSEGLREMSIQRRPQDSIQPLQLSRARPVIQRERVVHDHDDANGDQEPRDDDRNQHERSNDVRERHQEHSQRIRNGVVDGIDVLGEPVHDSAEGGGLEEAHGSMHDGGDGFAMEGLGREVREEADGGSGDKERDR